MISAQFARVLHRNLVNRGVDERALFAGTGFDRERIWHSSRLEPEGFLVLLRNARRLIDGQPLGFMLVGHNRLAGLGMMGMAMLSAPTLGDGLQAMSAFSTLQAGYVRVRVIAGNRQTSIQLILDELVGDTFDLHVESVLSLIQDYMEDIVGPFERDVSFQISYAEQGRRELYERYLRGKVQFNCKETGLTFPSAWLKGRSPYADTETWVIARQHLSEQLQQAAGAQDAPFTTHLRDTLSAHPPPLPDISQVADSLHLSTRTLNRRLSEEGQTFRQLKLEAIHNWARRMLLEGDSVEAIALALGYDNPANFRRSFREYVGHSPSEWLARERH